MTDYLVESRAARVEASRQGPGDRALGPRPPRAPFSAPSRKIRARRDLAHPNSALPAPSSETQNPRRETRTAASSIPHPCPSFASFPSLLSLRHFVPPGRSLLNPCEAYLTLVKDNETKIREPGPEIHSFAWWGESLLPVADHRLIGREP